MITTLPDSNGVLLNVLNIMSFGGHTVYFSHSASRNSSRFRVVSASRTSCSLSFHDSSIKSVFRAIVDVRSSSNGPGLYIENAEGQLPSIDEDAARAVDLLSSISPRNARHIFTDCSDIHLKSEKSFQTGRGRLEVTKKLGISRDVVPAGAAPNAKHS